MLKSLVSFVVLVWVILQTLAILGVNVAPFIASAGIVGVALGFGAQALVRDFLSGLFMLFEDQYGVGDWVDLGEAEGTVENVGLRITAVRDLHGTLWYCRNGDIMRVGNYSQDFGVAFLEIPVSYGADVDRACNIAIETAKRAAAEEPIKSNIISGPELAGVNELGADSWSLRMTAVTHANMQWATERELRRRIRNAFADAGIDAPTRRACRYRR
ncbi:mechanosensitive ion channel family protein [Dietzia aerolata]|uniref:mechanosensitive ion channel family protein n=1 Tax=Dietzia aerolata TaxID=595984 RepID=UPI003631D80F